MTREQFKENEEKAIVKLERAKERYNKALENYNNYKGNDTAEEHRLALMWQNADSQKVEAEKKLLELQTQYTNRAVMA